MNQKTIVFATVVAVVIVMIGSMYLMKGNQSGDDPPVSEWYVVYEEVADFSTPDIIPHFEYAVSEKRTPLIIEKVEREMFSGTFDGIPVIGGFNDSFIFFEICDEKRGVFSYFEGYLNECSISMVVIDYLDEDLSEVTGGMFLQLVQEDCTNIPDVEGYDMETITFSNGSGVVYSPGEEPGTLTTSEITPPAIEVVSQNRMVAITQLDPGDGRTIFALSVIAHFYDGAICGVMGYDMDDQVITAFFTIADGKASIIAESYSLGPSGEELFSYVDSTYDVDYTAGEQYEPLNIEGKWTGKVYDFDGTTVVEQPFEVIKDFTMVDRFVIHTEVLTVEGQEKTYTWLGYMDGDVLSVVNMHDGTTHLMIGYVDGDTLLISGYMGSNGEYSALHFELTRN